MKRTIGTIGSALCFAAACGGSTTFTEEPEDRIALDELPGELAGAYCSFFRRCAGPVYEVFFGHEDCGVLFAEQFRQGGFLELEEAVGDGRVTYDAESAATCVATITSRECSEAEQRSIPECERALVGSVPLGGDCELDEECEGSASGAARLCEIDAACPGTCVELYGAGHECGDNDECADGLVCSNVTRLCVAPRADGQSCGAGIEAQCASGLACLGEDAGATPPQTGTCHPVEEIPLGAAGEPCDLAGGELCDPGLSCALLAISDAGTLEWECRAIPAAGGDCFIGFPENCPSGQYCPIQPADVLTGTFQSSCEALPDAGQTCADRALGILPACAPYTRCDTATGSCIGLRDLGESCSSSELCYSQNCVDGGCEPPRACP